MMIRFNKIIISILDKSLFVALMMIHVFSASADVAVVPPELDKVILKIEERQNGLQVPATAAKIVVKDNQIVFVLPLGKKGPVYFDEQSQTIDRHVYLNNDRDSYAFEVILHNEGQVYHHVVRPIHGVDALFFFNDTEFFVYTQTTGDNGSLELKEWIYALKPNVENGSRWEWVFKSEKWHWPLTIEMEKNGIATIHRNMPFVGIPIEDKARSQYMLDMMIKFKRNEPLKKYFPYSEEVVSMPAARCLTNEGVSRVVDIDVQNLSVISADIPKPKVGLDFKRWDEHWKTTYTITITARPEEYPLFIKW